MTPLNRRARRKAGAPRRTGPTREVRELVFKRDRWRCVRCGRHLPAYGANLQHRKPRGMGGTHDPSVNQAANLIPVCGTGTTGCHGWIETHREEAHANGWSIPWWENPETVPVTYWDGRAYTLNNEGERQC